VNKELEIIKSMLKEKAPNFAREIQPIYRHLQWTWALEGDLKKIPNANEIKETLFELINGINKYPFNTSTGGLRIDVYEEHGVLYGSMQFIHEEELYIQLEGEGQ